MKVSSNERSVLDLLKQMSREITSLREEVSRLHNQIARPERIRYRPKELAKRLGFNSIQSVYNRWRDGALEYHKDNRGRFSTEKQVMEYEFRINQRGQSCRKSSNRSRNSMSPA